MDWIFSHIDDLDAEAAMDLSEGRSAAESVSESVPAAGPRVKDGNGRECPIYSSSGCIMSSVESHC